jgi:hypothetical protein
MVPARQRIELVVGEEVVLEDGAREFRVRKARRHADQGNEGDAEVGEGVAVGCMVEVALVARQGGCKGRGDGDVVSRWWRADALLYGA